MIPLSPVFKSRSKTPTASHTHSLIRTALSCVSSCFFHLPPAKIQTMIWRNQAVIGCGGHRPRAVFQSWFMNFGSPVSSWTIGWRMVSMRKNFGAGERQAFKSKSLKLSSQGSGGEPSHLRISGHEIILQRFIQKKHKPSIWSRTTTCHTSHLLPPAFRFTVLPLVTTTEVVDPKSIFTNEKNMEKMTPKNNMGVLSLWRATTSCCIFGVSFSESLGFPPLWVAWIGATRLAFKAFFWLAVFLLQSGNS